MFQFRSFPIERNVSYRLALKSLVIARVSSIIGLSIPTYNLFKYYKLLDHTDKKPKDR